MKGKKGITLIALIITIIVLLILAGVAINAITGDNGVMNKAQTASEKTNKAKLKEEIETELAALQADKMEQSLKLTKADIVKMLEKMGAIVLTYDENGIDGEYKDYQLVVDKNNRVTIGGLLSGAKPDIAFNPSTEDNGAIEVILTVTATSTEGGIESLESMDGLIPVSENGVTEKSYKITANGEYRFKAVGENGRIRIETKTISNILKESESIFSAIENITNTGVSKVKVLGKTKESTNPIEEIYSLDVIYCKSDLILSDSLYTTNEDAVDGLSLSDKTWLVRKRR